MVPWKIADRAVPQPVHEEFVMKKLVFGLLGAAATIVHERPDGTVAARHTPTRRHLHRVV